MKNLEAMKCNELRLMARDLGIKGYGSKGKEWLIPRIAEIMEAKEAEAKAAAEKKPVKEKKPRKVNLIEHDGKAQSLGAWAKELGMPVPTLRARLRSGWTIEQALSKASAGKAEKLVECNGKSQTLTAWSRELGIPRATLDARINRLHWAPEKALAARA